MYKLVIWIGALEDWPAFHRTWPEFLHLAEQMPGLRREATSRVGRILYGTEKPAWVHELFFDTQAELQQAMETPSGQAAGRLLQKITGGRMSLFIAEHSEDNIENIRRYHEDAD
jgi:uncharacterized protein (TIGR02118 family)